MVLTNEIIQEILDTGLIVVGSKKCGKSNASKILASEIIKNYPNIQCRIFDSCQNWIHLFEPIVCQKIDGDTRYLYTGDQSVLYDIGLMDTEQIMESIGVLMQNDFNKQRLLKSVNRMDKWIVYFIEEAQNVLGTFSLSKTTGKLWIKVISEGRNFNMAFILIGQRMADISAKAIERAQGYLFGKTSGDNDRRKIKRIVGDAIISEHLEGEEWIRRSGDEIVNEVPRLDTGEFIYFNGKNGRYMKFSEYPNKTTPIPLVRETLK
jgi:hypothetical protein